jgi:hypothetical protein
LKIAFIHGAESTPDSFNFIEPMLDKGFNGISIAYDSNNGFKSNLKTMFDDLVDEGDLFFVSHSLGGVYALHLSHLLGDQVKGSVSIATPFNGSESASMLNMIKPCQLYRDIAPYSDPILSSHKLGFSCPWTQIVTTGGKSHWMSEDNDGVVTKASMMRRKDMEFKYVHSSHYEVMLSNRTVDIINNCLKEV